MAYPSDARDWRSEVNYWATACIAAGLAVTDPKTGKVVLDRRFHNLRRSGIREMCALAIETVEQWVIWTTTHASEDEAG